MEHPEFMQVRRAVRRAIDPLPVAADSLVLVGLSGGADSLALAAALAAEAARLGVRAGAIIVDHGLQQLSAATAAFAAAKARALGLDPVVVRSVTVTAENGPEAAARDARYGAFTAVASELEAAAILTAHTRDDQAEQVLLALARGSGTRSIAGIPPVRQLSDATLLLRPLIAADPEITRATTVAACGELGLTPWQDPHNVDHAYARVRVRETVLPLLAAELGPGVRAGLGRSADLAREDAEALDGWAAAVVAELAQLAEPAELAEPAAHELFVLGRAGIARLAELPAAVRQRAIHRIASERFGASLGREHTLAIAELVTQWRGQGPVFVPGLRITRSRGQLRFERQLGSPRV